MEEIIGNTNTGLATTDIDADNNLELIFTQDDNGVAQIIVQADDNSTRDTEVDTFIVTVNSINDKKAPPIL